MAWIDEVAADDWADELAELKPKVADPATGDVDHIMSIHSLDAGSLSAHLQLYSQAMKGTDGLPKVDREMIALVVSKTNGCHYWVTHHRRGLRRLLRDDELAAAVESDFRSAPIDNRRQAMLEYCEKLTKTPADMVRSDVELLRTNGFSDIDILHIAEVASYYAYVNRIADGLGVDIESPSGTRADGAG